MKDDLPEVEESGQSPLLFDLADYCRLTARTPGQVLELLDAGAIEGNWFDGRFMFEAAQVIRQQAGPNVWPEPS